MTFFTLNSSGVTHWNDPQIHYCCMVSSLSLRYELGDFKTLWATFQSWRQQLFCPNCPYCQAIFVKVSKSFIFLVKSLLGNFYRYLATFYLSHCHTGYHYPDFSKLCLSFVKGEFSMLRPFKKLRLSF